MIPLYGFLEGDTLGILLLAEETETVAELATKLQQSSRLRVAYRAEVVLVYRGRVVDPRLTVGQAQFEALERVDVRAGGAPR
jgi:hypothetical protein